jgi:hypothetical protein
MRDEAQCNDVVPVFRIASFLAMTWYLPDNRLQGLKPLQGLLLQGLPWQGFNNTIRGRVPTVALSYLNLSSRRKSS